MKRELIKELRGETRRDAMDIYDHVDITGIRARAFAAIPQLGLELTFMVSVKQERT